MYRRSAAMENGKYTRFARRTDKRAFRARKKLDKLARRRDLKKAQGRLAKADKLQRKMNKVAARGGVSPKGRRPGVPGVPGVRRRAPRYKHRVRKGQKQYWDPKYRGWLKVPSRRRRKLPSELKDELDALKQGLDTLRTLIAVVK